MNSWISGFLLFIFLFLVHSSLYLKHTFSSLSVVFKHSRYRFCFAFLSLPPSSSAFYIAIFPDRWNWIWQIHGLIRKSESFDILPQFSIRREDWNLSPDQRIRDLNLYFTCVLSSSVISDLSWIATIRIILICVGTEYREGYLVEKWQIFFISCFSIISIIFFYEN